MNALAGRPVLVIGGLGFIGVNLTARLADLDARLTVLTPTRERHPEQSAAFDRRGIRIVEGDIRDRGLMTHLVSGQSIVFNLSGQSGAVRSMEDPWTDLDVNLRGNLVLLEAMREVSPGAKVVLAGSRLQYGRPVRLPVGEDDTSEPLCLHAVHKRTAEQYLRLYGRLFGVRYAVARIANPFGPGQPSGRTAYGVVNRFIHLALADEPLKIYGEGLQQRDYVHVDDVVEALLRIGSSDASDGHAYNVGSGTGARMIDVARLIVDIAGGGRIEHVEWPALAAEIETGDFVADISRIRRELGWMPCVSLRDGLERTVAFYRARVAS